MRLLKAPETAPDDVVASVDAWQAQAEKTADIPLATAADMEWDATVGVKEIMR